MVDDYASYLKSDWWLRLRELALEHYGRSCALCGSDKKLNVHHRTYKRLGSERLGDLTILCRDCHARFHADRAEPEPVSDPLLEQLRTAWSRTILPMLNEQSVPLASMLQSASPLRLGADDELWVAFPEPVTGGSFSFHCLLANEDRNREVVERCLAELTGRDLRVVFTT